MKHLFKQRCVACWLLGALALGGCATGSGTGSGSIGSGGVGAVARGAREQAREQGPELGAVQVAEVRRARPRDPPGGGADRHDLVHRTGAQRPASSRPLKKKPIS